MKVMEEEERRAWCAARAVFATSIMLMSVIVHGGEKKQEPRLADSTHACRWMMQTKQYVGCWSGGEMFGKFSVAFDPDGEGFLVGGMSANPFRWTADDKGNITLQLPAPYGEIQEIKARYDPETDTMRLSNSATGYRNVKMTSSHPGKDLQKTINAEMERKMEQPRREKNSDRVTAKRTFANIDALVDWLTIRIETVGKGNGFLRGTCNWYDGMPGTYQIPATAHFDDKPEPAVYCWQWNGGGSTGTKCFDESVYYCMRLRTRLAEDGSVIGAHYGKLFFHHGVGSLAQTLFVCAENELRLE